MLLFNGCLVALQLTDTTTPECPAPQRHSAARPLARPTITGPSFSRFNLDPASTATMSRHRPGLRPAAAQSALMPDRQCLRSCEDQSIALPSRLPSGADHLDLGLKTSWPNPLFVSTFCLICKISDAISQTKRNMSDPHPAPRAIERPPVALISICRDVLPFNLALSGKKSISPSTGHDDVNRTDLRIRHLGQRVSR